MEVIDLTGDDKDDVLVDNNNNNSSNTTAYNSNTKNIPSRRSSIKYKYLTADVQQILQQGVAGSSKMMKIQHENREVLDLDDEDQEYLKEAQMLAERCKKRRVDPQEQEIQCQIDTISNSMAQELGGSVDVEILKESLAATKNLYRKGEDWYERWTTAAQDYMVTLMENKNEAQKIGAAMAQSLREVKSVDDMQLQELFAEFENKSYILNKIFDLLDRQRFVHIQSAQLTEAFKKMLQLEKQCFHLYGRHREAVQAYFDALLAAAGLHKIRKKMDKMSMDKLTDKTRKKNGRDSEQAICSFLSTWHQNISQSVIKFEENKKKYVVPEIFQSFLPKQKKQEVDEDGIIIID